MTCRADRNDVVVIGGNVGISALIAEHLKVGDVITCDVEPVKVIRINRGCIAPPIEKVLINHGDYRQFEKRDKRKNFKRI